MTHRPLWYDTPATDWEREALPIGNGTLGAMVFGGVARERIQFNEKSLWTGGPPPANRTTTATGARRARAPSPPSSG